MPQSFLRLHEFFLAKKTNFHNEKSMRKHKTRFVNKEIKKFVHATLVKRFIESILKFALGKRQVINLR